MSRKNDDLLFFRSDLENDPEAFTDTFDIGKFKFYFRPLSEEDTKAEQEWALERAREFGLVAEELAALDEEESELQAEERLEEAESRALDRLKDGDYPTRYKIKMENLTAERHLAVIKKCLVKWTLPKELTESAIDELLPPMRLRLYSRAAALSSLGADDSFFRPEDRKSRRRR